MRGRNQPTVTGETQAVLSHTSAPTVAHGCACRANLRACHTPLRKRASTITRPSRYTAKARRGHVHAVGAIVDGCGSSVATIGGSVFCVRALRSSGKGGSVLGTA